MTQFQRRATLLTTVVLALTSCGTDEPAPPPTSTEALMNTLIEAEAIPDAPITMQNSSVSMGHTICDVLDDQDYDTVVDMLYNAGNSDPETWINASAAAYCPEHLDEIP